MEQVTIRLIPRNLDNPTIEQSTTNPSHVISDIARDTYDYSIESADYEEVTGIIIVGVDRWIEEVDLVEIPPVQVETWVSKTRTRSVDYQTIIEYDDTLYPNQGYTVDGVRGEETQTYELKYINGQPTSHERNVSAWLRTKAPVNGKLVIGTKEDEVELVNVLTQDNAETMYGTNTYIDDVRTPGDAVPINGEIFELRQWDPPSVRLNIYDGNLEASAQYTLAMELENIGNAIATAKFLIGMSFFGGKHYFNGSEVTIDPVAGEYNFKPHMPNNGKVTYLFQFTTEPNTPNGDYFQISVDNANDDIMLRVSNLGLYAGHINPFGA